MSVASEPTGGGRTQGEIGEVRGHLRETPELSSSTTKGWYGQRAGMEPEQTVFLYFNGMSDEWEDGPQAET